MLAPTPAFIDPQFFYKFTGSSFSVLAFSDFSSCKSTNLPQLNPCEVLGSLVTCASSLDLDLVLEDRPGV